MPRVRFVLLPLLLAALLAVPAHIGGAASRAPCEEPTRVAGVGLACPVDGGFLVISPDGLVGFTHGVDHPPSDFTVSAMRQDRLQPPCVPTTEPHNQVLYVQPLDKPYRPDSVVPLLRDMVNRSNGVLRAEAAEFGKPISYRFSCDANGLVSVLHAPINLTSSQLDFGDVVGEVRRLGYTHSKAKYWMWSDGGDGGGVAYFRSDDRLAPDNANNRAAPDYALTKGATGDWGVLVLMHESGHNLGAVQLSAPHTSGAAHCNDGYDIMCYNDGGSKSAYTTSACPQTTHFDCNHDDYFHPSPPEGSYLATRWNLASVYNQWLDFREHPPSLRPFYCQPDRALPDTQVRCTLIADAPGRGVAFEVDWGDGLQRVPASGFVASGTWTPAEHAWSARGVYDVRVVAVDNGTPPMRSDERSYTVRIGCVHEVSRTLLVGMRGIEVDNVSARWERVPASCHGQPFTLDFGFMQDFDVCWYAGGERLRCDVGEGPQTGRVPQGADRARIVYASGVNGAYFLSMAEG